MKTIDDALKYADTFDSPHNQHMSIVMLASEVRRLRDEVNGLTGSLDRAEKALKEAQEQEQEPVAWLVRHDQAQQLSVQIMKTEAEFEGKEMQYWYRNHSEDGEDIPAVIEPLYARPVPANLVESHQIKRDSNSLEFEGIKTAPAVAAGLPAIGPYRDFIPAPAVPAPSVPEEWRKVMTELADDLSIELDMRYQSRSHYPSELRKYENEMQLVYRARALLQSDPQPTNGDAK